MKTLRLIKLAVFAATTLASSFAFACGEMMFSAGMGLPFQSYLAPRPANVLLVSTATDAERATLYGGLERAGHHVTFVADEAGMAEALRRESYDVVIASYDSIGAVTAQVATSASGSKPQLLPVIARSLRKSPEIRERFTQFLLEGASLGKYLATINRVLLSGTS